MRLPLRKLGMLFVRLVCLCGLLMSGPTGDRQVNETSKYLNVTTWNLYRFGRQGSDLALIASVLTESDLVFVQELLVPKGIGKLRKLAQQISRQTGKSMCAQEFIPNNRVRLGMGVLWDPNRVKMTSGSSTDCSTEFIQSTTLRTSLRRHPMIVRLTDLQAGYQFQVINLHLQSRKELAKKELGILMQYIRTQRGPTLIAGDFNLEETNSAFVNSTRLGFSPCLRNQPTTLKKRQRGLNRALDNIWVRGISLKCQVANLVHLFPELGMNQIRQKVSDHSPVMAKIHRLTGLTD